MAYQLLQGSRVAGANPARQHTAPRVASGRRILRISAVAELEKAVVARGSTIPVPASTDIASKLRYLFGRNGDYSVADAYKGTAWSVREKLIDSFNKTHEHWR